ncbi:MAG: hypothetical protein NC923_07755, partial [Candidatus Omnitrophica bacterium]|nr:hypothetical protein [Candidatus Omnitrophota bacterium]
KVECKFPAAFTLLAILLFLPFIRRIRFSYWLFGILAIGIPLSSMGDDIFRHMLRYLLPAFPLYVILADIGSNRYRDELISISLALLQGFLMVFWSNGFTLII